ncbi:MAG: hypothetical protein RML93_01340 [Anaerolineales bacterium]|nr:hypothetical protein [Anaerolineales bacterium]MDW8445915.1 hypothetical protein [Anaerolineales bacterium]
MRITPETILEIARNAVARRVRNDLSILAAYLCGSTLEDDFLLGGTVDIDLVLIHIDQVSPPREIERLTDEVHLDIAHHSQKQYEPARALRTHPWLGPALYSGKPLYDRAHVLDFIQASVRGMFNSPQNVIGRARPQAEHARQMWFELRDIRKEIGLKEVRLYLKALECAANAIALLSGDPLTERRFLVKFAHRAAAIGRPGLAAGLIGLLGGAEVQRETLQTWQLQWEEAFAALPETPRSTVLHPARRAYYGRAFEFLVNGAEPRAVLWPLLCTWLEMVAEMGEGSVAAQGWNEITARLGLSGDDFCQRVMAFDAFLDQVEEALEEWAQRNGA